MGFLECFDAIRKCKLWVVFSLSFCCGLSYVHGQPNPCLRDLPVDSSLFDIWLLKEEKRLAKIWELDFDGCVVPLPNRESIDDNEVYAIMKMKVSCYYLELLKLKAHVNDTSSFISITENSEHLPPKQYLIYQKADDFFVAKSTLNTSKFGKEVCTSKIDTLQASAIFSMLDLFFWSEQFDEDTKNIRETGIVAYHSATVIIEARSGSNHNIILRNAIDVYEPQLNLLYYRVKMLIE
ncbi:MULTISPECIES: hypothetical protein [unclassified Imperialibacter]|uniref:hypothetical protein n=1 Tax=unclassified Imperialibacter TaxID=2629706 RepID=UPI00125403BF|nr:MULTISPECIES: hypothetical protein [unclassified Imperialibacter]CAD5265071.1 hypothetical protein IMPERIA89_300072 [Imperialibacter sp. 89]CAD5269962.1 hypothetical protein IMPERIA75_360073 [Imperialibacter sp. 75]VVT09556.1 hypothetical protein IMPR6_180074 [Imperialibacter sp. EC-SDR9]